MGINKIAYEIQCKGNTVYGAFTTESKVTQADIEKKTKEIFKSLNIQDMNFKVTKVIKADQLPEDKNIPFIKEMENLTPIIQKEADKAKKIQ